MFAIMVEPTIQQRVQALLDTVRDRPTELPIAHLADLSQEPLRVSIDRAGPEAVVFITPRPDPRFDALTNRQYEVATLVAAGFTNQQIADALFVSLGTVKDHVHAILKRTNLASRSEVAACWYGHL